MYGRKYSYPFVHTGDCRTNLDLKPYQAATTNAFPNGNS
jgi:hypothetical protein